MRQFYIVVFCLLIFWSTGYSQENYFKRLPVQIESYSNKESVIVAKDEGNLERLLCFFKMTLNNYKHNLVVTTSSDGGYNWSNPDSIYYLPEQNSDIQAFVTNSGRILLSFKGNAYYLKYSDDGGLNWSQNIILPAGRTASNTSFVQFSDNRIGFIYINYPQLRIIYSYDDGITWSESSLLFPFSVDKGKMIISPSGEYFVFCTRPNDNNLYYSKSSDLISWSSLAVIDSGNTKVERFECAINKYGYLIVSYERNVPTLFQEIYQKDIFQIISIDNGNTWSSPYSITKFKGDDYNHSISKFSDGQVITFASKRDSIYEQIYYGFLPQDEDIKAPPAIYKLYHTPEQPEEDQPVTFRVYVDDDTKVQSVKLVIFKNKELPDTLLMYDDGLKNDSLANDSIFGVGIPGQKPGDIIKYYCIAEDNFGNISTSGEKILFIPLDFEVQTYCFENNRYKMPMNNAGVFADVLINGIDMGRYDESLILFSGGFILSGYDDDFLWVNVVFSASRIQDYLPGYVGSNRYDPKNNIYVINSEDLPFSKSWQNYKYAVMIGAPFYDGDFDGEYIPVDKNSNGMWDEDEDAPEMLGDITTWCVFNDGVNPLLRRFNDVYPLGIEIQQTAFSFNLNENNLPDEKIYVRYRIINRGKVNSVLDSVIFSFYLDPDIGNYSNDLIACDTLLNLGYAYSYGDSEFGINPPATGIALVQGPPVYVKNETFIDNNNDNIFQSDIDIPLDSALFKSGMGIPSVILPGAKNQNITSYFSVIQIDLGEILTDKYAHRGWQNSLLPYNRLIDPCTFPYGIVLGPYDCSEINPIFLFSGNPVVRDGWLCNENFDVRFILSTGQFTLKKDEPVDIWGVYIAGRGEDSLQSITKLKENTLNAHLVYQQFPINEERIPPPGLPVEYHLHQNYPNPFNPGTKIRYELPVNNFVTIKIFDILGREVKTLVNEFKPAGRYEIDFDGTVYASGVYFYQIKAGNYLNTKKMILIK